MDVKAIREQIPATRKTCYLNTGWSGPSPRVVMDRIREWMEYESTEGPTALPVLREQQSLMGRVREAMAALINAASEEVTLTQNTTEGINIVLNGMEWRRGDEVVTCSIEHPSVLVPAFFLRERRGVHVKVLEISAQEGEEAIIERFAGSVGPRTRLIFLSHVQYSCGLRMPVRELAEMAHERGARILLDGAQGAGHLELDMKAMDCDFYSFPGHKWLLGPDGVGGLYVRRELIPELQPWKVSHHAVMGHDSHWDATPRTDDIEKFELTTTSAPLWAGLVAAIRFIREIGIAAMEARARDLGVFAAERLAEVPGVTVTSPLEPGTRSGLVTFTVDGMDPRTVVGRLWERGRIVARSISRPPGVRLSTAVFNTAEELEAVAALVREMGGSR